MFPNMQPVKLIYSQCIYTLRFINKPTVFGIVYSKCNIDLCLRHQNNETFIFLLNCLFVLFNKHIKKTPTFRKKQNSWNLYRLNIHYVRKTCMNNTVEFGNEIA